MNAAFIRQPMTGHRTFISPQAMFRRVAVPPSASSANSPRAERPTAPVVEADAGRDSGR